MPTLNFTQFGQPTTVNPTGDHIVGYQNNNNVSQEARWSLEKLATDILPTAGLGTKQHQVRKLARINYEGTYSMAAITKREEVICWGQNVKSTPFISDYNTAQYKPREITSKFQYTKFGAGFESVDRAPAFQPTLIPFVNPAATPKTENPDIYNLQQNGLTIVDLIWDEWSSLALLSDGTVWIKAAFGELENNGFFSTDMPSRPYFGSAYFKIKNWNLTTLGADLSAARIDSLPKAPPVTGALYCVLDQNGDLHLWGETTRLTPAYSLWPGSPNKASAPTPINITKDNPNLRGKVRDFKLGGDIATNATYNWVNPAGTGAAVTNGQEHLQIITTDNKLFGIGFNATGVLGTKETTALTTSNFNLWNKSDWTQAYYKDPSDNVVKLVDNALSFLHSKHNIFFSGYITVPSAGSNRINQIYVTGTNEYDAAGSVFNQGLGQSNSVAMSIDNTYYKLVSNSTTGDPFAKGFINGDHTLVCLTERGQVYAAGKNKSGEAGTRSATPAPIGAIAQPVSYQPMGALNAIAFGTPGQLSAIDCYYCVSSINDNITGIKTKAPNGKIDLWVAGNYTFAGVGDDVNPKNNTFRLFPVKENIKEVVHGGTLGQNQWTMILTDTGRTYGVGYGPFELIAGTSFSRTFTTARTITHTYKFRGRWYSYYSYSYSVSTYDYTLAWNPQPVILF
jgi:alpha-tubulin suppressor-like RCC1 family protein